MADFYTVAVDNTTAVEITGGRVGHFVVTLQTVSLASLRLGPSTLAVSYGPTVLTDGVQVTTGAPYSFYVTSPDSVYALFVQGGGLVTDTLDVFHNR